MPRQRQSLVVCPKNEREEKETSRGNVNKNTFWGPAGCKAYLLLFVWVATSLDRLLTLRSIPIRSLACCSGPLGQPLRQFAGWTVQSLLDQNTDFVTISRPRQGETDAGCVCVCVCVCVCAGRCLMCQEKVVNGNTCEVCYDQIGVCYD